MKFRTLVIKQRMRFAKNETQKKKNFVIANCIIPCFSEIMVSFYIFFLFFPLFLNRTSGGTSILFEERHVSFTDLHKSRNIRVLRNNVYARYVIESLRHSLIGSLKLIKIHSVYIFLQKKY